MKNRNFAHRFATVAILLVAVVSPALPLIVEEEKGTSSRCISLGWRVSLNLHVQMRLSPSTKPPKESTGTATKIGWRYVCCLLPWGAADCCSTNCIIHVGGSLPQPGMFLLMVYSAFLFSICSVCATQWFGVGGCERYDPWKSVDRIKSLWVTECNLTLVPRQTLTCWSRLSFM